MTLQLYIADSRGLHTLLCSPLKKIAKTLKGLAAETRIKIDSSLLTY